jgi:hypothetical protein
MSYNGVLHPAQAAVGHKQYRPIFISGGRRVAAHREGRSPRVCANRTEQPKATASTGALFGNFVIGQLCPWRHARSFRLQA